MTDEDDASPLRSRADVPPEMVRALRALQAEGPSRASLDQVAARLGGLLDAAPPAAPSAAGWLLRSVGIRAVALRVGMAVLALGATAVWLRSGAREREPARTPAGVASEADQPIAADDPGREPSALAAGEQRGAEQAKQTSDAAGAARASASSLDGETGRFSHDGSGGRAHRTRARPVRGRSSGSAALSEPAGLARAVSTAQRTEIDTDGPLAAQQRAETSADKPDAAVPPAVAAQPESPSARKLSEVELLLEARRLAAREPKAAQRLLEQHAVRFPDGVLAPEREVLAIEVLKKLGQTAAAERRLRAFRARYPNSMHLRRLSSPPADGER